MLVAESNNTELGLGFPMSLKKFDSIYSSRHVNTKCARFIYSTLALLPDAGGYVRMRAHKARQHECCCNPTHWHWALGNPCKRTGFLL